MFDNTDLNTNFLELFLTIVQDSLQKNNAEAAEMEQSDMNDLTSDSIPNNQDTDEDDEEQKRFLYDEQKKRKIQELLEQNNKLLQKQNQIKNILKAFQKHITQIDDPGKKDLYCDLYSKARVSFFNLRKIITKRIKDKQTRWNMKLKSILKSKGIGILFNYFLKNEAENWLKNSKVENKNQLQQLINFLIYLHSHEDEFDIIKTYKK